MVCYRPHVIGKVAEDGALNLLKKNGCQLLARNFQCKSGEIDLIVLDKQTVVFVEVRYRKNARYGHAQETINYVKMLKIKRSAQYFLQIRQHLAKLNGRFDVIAVYPHNNGMQFNWIKNAFCIEE